MSDTIQFGCMKCKKTKRTKRAHEVATKTIEDVFESVFNSLHNEAASLGVDIPQEFKAKMLKWGAKQGIFTPQEEVEGPLLPSKNSEAK